MKLNLPEERRAYRIPKKKGERAEETTLPAGINEYVEIPNPDGGSASQPWLVLASDPTVGLAKQSLLMTPGLKVVPEAKPEDAPPPAAA